MSWEATTWARRQRTGDPVTKAVLVGIANWMPPSGEGCAVSMKYLAEEVEVSTRTCQRHIARLEKMGLVTKENGHRKDGGQGWNEFKFPTYTVLGVSIEEPPVSTAPITLDAPEQQQADPHDKLSGGEGDKLSGGEGDNLSPPLRQIVTPPATDCHGPLTDCRGPHDNRVRGGKGKGTVITPLSPPRGATGNSAKREGTKPLPERWAPPALSELPPAAQAKARQWPTGAYEAEAETFRANASAEGGRAAYKRDWNAAWVAHINRSTVRVLNEARAGVRHAAPAAPAQPATPSRSLDTSGEGEAARLIRKQLARTLGREAIGGFFDRCRLDVERDTLTIATPSQFALNYMRDNYEHDTQRATNHVLGPDADLRWKVEDQ
ncbi:MAG: winged helix-turn-helix domain-containing protein [Pseudomonadota bacterium]|nr:winged helix-turn-helix domain-containing protein [Pseudomonadota bacterium]